MFQLKRLIVILLQLSDHEKDILREKRYDYHQLKESLVINKKDAKKIIDVNKKLIIVSYIVIHI